MSSENSHSNLGSKNMNLDLADKNPFALFKMQKTFEYVVPK